MKYLKSDKHYNDQYDLFTIKECLGLEEQSLKLTKSLQKIKASEKDKTKASIMVHNLLLYHAKGEKYKKKAETIRKWMDADQLRDEKLANTSPPSGIFCDYCDEVMSVYEKVLHDIGIDKLWILFFFKCSHCNKRKALFEDGEEFSYTERCPKCKSEIKSKDSRKGNIVTTLYSCPNCGYKNKEVMDLDKNREQRRRKKEADKKLLKKYKEKYCLSDKEGQEYIAEVERIKILIDMVKEHEQKEKDPVYKKARKLKKLKVLELEKLLKKVLEKENYINLQFDKPQINRFVIIPFTAQDTDNKREEYDSRNNLRKIIKKALEKTNWRLTSDGVDYRLGYSSGKLKGYENEEDLAKIFKANYEKN